MKVHGYPIFAALLLGSLLAWSHVGAVEVTGVPPSQRREVQRLAMLKPAVLENADSTVIRLRDAGYLDAEATLSGDTLIVHSGPRYVLSKLQVHEGDSASTVAVDHPFTRAAVQRSLESLLAGYQRRGYFYATVRVDSVLRTDSSATISVSITPGPVATVGEVTVAGLRRTDRSLVRRLLPVAVGDTLTDALLHRLERAAGRLDFVSFRPPVRTLVADGYTSVDIEVPFEERTQVSFRGGADTFPTTAPGWSGLSICRC